MHLVVGLGNPGPSYKKNRHNIGFMVAEEIASRFSLGPDRTRFQSITNDGLVDGHKILLLRPQTYMNESGARRRRGLALLQARPDRRDRVLR